jgi:DNA-binding MarR family transcriptional regulator
MTAAIGAHPATPAEESRRILTEQLLTEVTAWSPRDRMTALKLWHAGSMSIIHLTVLSTLEALGPQPMGALAEDLDVSVASATGIVDRMEKRGFVVRTHGAQDRRLVLVHPTDQGLHAVRQFGEHRRERFARMLGGLDAKQLRVLLSALRTIHAARDTTAEPAGTVPEALR